MEHRIEILLAKKMVGMNITMTFAENTTANLWRGFMPRRGEVTNRVDDNFYSLQRYVGGNNPLMHGIGTPFVKWALVEVDDNTIYPDGMEPYDLPEGEYAVFKHKGSAATAMQTITSIFEEWLPNSGYELDVRPHFEKMKEGYNPISDEAEEEFWIPIKLIS